MGKLLHKLLGGRKGSRYEDDSEELEWLDFDGDDEDEDDYDEDDYEYEDDEEESDD